jgi:general secretion pathway protein D
MLTSLNRNSVLAAALAVLTLSASMPAQPPVAIPPGFGPQAERPAQVPAQAPAQPPAGAAKPAAGQAAPPAPALPAAPPSSLIGGLNLQNVSLVEVVDYLARELKLNYIMDKRVSGGVTLNTYGEVKNLDKRALLDTILRINGFAMVQTGDVYRIVPLAELARMPLKPQVDAKDMSDDDKAILNLVFLKYANVEELAKLIGEFLGPEGKAWSYPPANLLLVLDSSRNMRRTMEMISLFDSDFLAKQRVRLFNVKNSRPTDLAKEMEGLLKSMSLSKDLTTVKFVPVDRINTLIAVAPNPGVFDQVQEWIDRLDVKVKNSAGKIDNYVYRVKYGQAYTLAMSIMMLYMQMTPGYGMGGMYGGMGGMYGGMGGMYGGMSGMYGGMSGMYGGMSGMYGGMNGMYGGMNGIGQVVGVGTSGLGVAGGTGVAGSTVTPPGIGGMTMGSGMGYGGDMTGSYLGMGGMGMGMYGPRSPRVVPNPTDNSLLILATREEYESISKMLAELDIPPRQVLIEARIYEVRLTGAFSWGISYFLQNRNSDGSVTPPTGTTKEFSGSFSKATLGLTAGALVGQSKALFGLLNTQELATRVKVVSAPSIVATDSIAASLNVGTEVPTLTAQAVTGAQSGGSSLFANTVSNRKSGVTLNITARVNPSGVVTMLINQEVSSPVAPDSGAAIQSPSFSQRTVQTQVTVQDGDMIAIGGIINETNTSSSTGVPVLGKLPLLGYAFSNRASNRERSELVIFISPRVIYDTNELTEASDDLVSRMRRLQKIMR